MNVWSLSLSLSRSLSVFPYVRVRCISFEHIDTCYAYQNAYTRIVRGIATLRRQSVWSCSHVCACVCVCVSVLRRSTDVKLLFWVGIYFFFAKYHESFTLYIHIYAESSSSSSDSSSGGRKKSIFLSSVPFFILCVDFCRQNSNENGFRLTREKQKTTNQISMKRVS